MLFPQVSYQPDLLTSTVRLRKEVNKYNVELGDYEKIKKFDIVPDEWSQKNGLLTPTLKVKRNKAIEFYKENIDKLFA